MTGAWWGEEGLVRVMKAKLGGGTRFSWLESVLTTGGPAAVLNNREDTIDTGSSSERVSYKTVYMTQAHALLLKSYLYRKGS